VTANFVSVDRSRGSLLLDTVTPIDSAPWTGLIDAQGTSHWRLIDSRISGKTRRPLGGLLSGAKRKTYAHCEFFAF